MELVYRPVIGVAVTLFKIMGWRVQVRGAHHVPATGPAVIASNHVSYLDFVFVGYGARAQGKRLVRFAAKKEIFDHRVAGPLMRGMKHISVDRFGDVEAAMRAAAAKLAAGELVGMFPEGTISRSFMPMTGRSGAARMAIDAGVPLVPAAVWGPQRLLTKSRPRDLTRRDLDILVAFGPHVDYEPGEDARRVTRRLMAAITDLVTDLQDTYPQRPAPGEDPWWLPARLGGTAPTPEEADRLAREERRAKRAAAQRSGDGEDA